jgi:hypothetical protein
MEADMHARPPLLVALLLVLGSVYAQNGGWNVDSDFDLYSFGGLGSVWTTAQQHPADVAPADAALVVGCDRVAPFGVEISAWVAPLGTTAFGPATSASLDVEVMVRFDQGPILRQTWFVAEGYFQTEAVAYYDLNETLLAGMADATTMALRIRADPARGVQERTFVYDVRGFALALARLTCADDEPPPATAPPATARRHPIRSPTPRTTPSRTTSPASARGRSMARPACRPAMPPARSRCTAPATATGSRSRSATTR